MLLDENLIGSRILEAAIKVHTALGPGLLESTYESCMEFELRKMGLTVQSQVPLPLVYGDVKLECGYRVDLLVEGKVIVELKSVEALNEIHFSQVLTYIKLSGCKLGYLLNFNVKYLRNGIRRIINGKI